MMYRTSVFLALWIGLLVNGLRAEIRPDFLMDSDPEIRDIELIKVFRDDLVPLWIQALQRPEVDLQRMTAESIAQAQSREVSNLLSTVPLLEKILTADGSHPVARFSAAKALITIDSRTSSEKLLDASIRYGSDLRRLVEPAMAKWDFVPARAVWKQRLEAANVRQRDLILAMHGMAVVQDTSSLVSLKAIALDLLRTSDVRLEAASAAGMLVETGLEGDAESLMRQSRGDQNVHRHCALRLMARHRSSIAIDHFKELASDTDSSVASLALTRLNDIDHELVLPFAERAFVNADVRVREQAARAYLTFPTTERITPLAELLDDPIPSLRRHVCEELLKLAARPELNDTIRSSAMTIIARDSWRGQEQASLLLAELEHSPAARRMSELLESPRSEVMVAAAWSLRKVANPESVPAIIDKIRRQTVARKISTNDALDEQVAHLFEACGKMKVKDAEPLMMEYVPKAPIMGDRSRSGAIWALGWLYEGTPNETVRNALMERITDIGLMPPEFKRVKRLSVVAFGRMKSISDAEKLRAMMENTQFGNAIRWTVHELTGEWLPAPPPLFSAQGTWFLEPVADLLLPSDKSNAAP